MLTKEQQSTMVLQATLPDAYAMIKRWWGVEIRVELGYDPGMSGGNLLWWRVVIPWSVHRAELDNPPEVSVPFLDLGMVPTDAQISSVLALWLENLHDHLKVGA